MANEKDPLVFDPTGTTSPPAPAIGLGNGGEGRIKKTPGVCGGDACVRDSRIPVWGLEGWRRLGWSDDRLLAEYPSLTRDDLAAAWDYAARNREEVDQAIRENEEA